MQKEKLAVSQNLAAGDIAAIETIAMSGDVAATATESGAASEPTTVPDADTASDADTVTESDNPNRKIKDNSHKVIFGDNTLCAQFIRDYVPIPMLKSVQPEDLEDISDKFIPLFTTERESDVVKRIHLHDEKTAFLVSLIEHKTKVDYNVIMQLLRYMCYIWEDYEKEMLKKKDRDRDKDTDTEQDTLTSVHKDFKYPPIIPIVYYEGCGTWTAAMNLKDRISLSDVFEAYIPDFTYELIQLQSYSNEQLMKHENEISLIMLLNKLQSLADLEGISDFKNYQQNILAESPEHLLNIIATITTILLNRLKLPSEEIEGYVSLIKEKKMPELFEYFEKVDVPKMREEIQAEREEIQAERDKMQAEKDKMQAERDEMQAEHIRIMADFQIEREELQAKGEELQAKGEELQVKEEALQAKEETLQSELAAMQAMKAELQALKAELNEKLSALSVS